MTNLAELYASLELFPRDLKLCMFLDGLKSFTCLYIWSPPKRLKSRCRDGVLRDPNAQTQIESVSTVKQNLERSLIAGR